MLRITPVLLLTLFLGLGWNALHCSNQLMISGFPKFEHLTNLQCVPWIIYGIQLGSLLVVPFLWLDGKESR